MIPPNGETNETLYEQVLDFARKEIEDASSQMEELRRALHVVEARVEAAKSVYESVAARLNLEDEMEDEARLDVTQFSNLPPMPSQSTAPPASDEPAPTQTPAQATPKSIVPPVAKEPEPPLFAPESAPPAFVAPPMAPPVAPEPPVLAPPPVAPEPTPVAPAPVTPEPAPPAFVAPPVAPEPPVLAPPPVTPEPTPVASAPPPSAPEPVPQTPEAPPSSVPFQPEEKQPVETSEASAVNGNSASDGNGASDGFSMDLIRKHLEAREKAAQVASQAPTRRPEASPELSPAPPVQAEAPSAPAPTPPPAPAPAPKPATEVPAATQPAQGGFPGLSEADRALIGEYLRSKRD